MYAGTWAADPAVMADAVHLWFDPAVTRARALPLGVRVAATR
jgi:hypothetical protein